MNVSKKNIEEKSVAMDTAAVVTAIGAAIPAGKIIGSAVRQVVDNIKHKGGNENG